jgi:hypothetical protein
MLAIITKTIARFKESWGLELDDEAIQSAMREAGHVWRDRELNPVTTVRMFLLQILFGNAACDYVPRLAGKSVTGGAYCAARGRLPLEALQALLTRCTSAMSAAVRDTGLWLGHRLFVMDGSSFSMPDTDELRDHFGQSGGQAVGCGFPTAHWLALVHFGSGLFQKVIAAPLRTHDMSEVTQLHPELQAGDVVLGDRALCSFAHLSLLVSRSVHALLRLHQRVVADFTRGRAYALPGSGKSEDKKGLPRSRQIRKLGPLDQIVEWFRPVNRPAWMSAEAFAALPEVLRVRELRYTVARKGFRVKAVTLVTTLLDPQVYTAEKLAEAYGLRWTIETSFGHIKTTMKMDVLRCQTVRGILKELTMFLLIYNLVRVTMVQAAQQQDVPVDRVSFVDALRWLATTHHPDILPPLNLVPLRPGRYEPRCRKRRPKQYPLMQKPRAKLRQLLESQDVTD